MSFSLGDKLEGEKWKSPSFDLKLRCAPLTATTHEAERASVLPALIPIRNEKATIPDYLG
jgi:hypothetical protein